MSPTAAAPSLIAAMGRLDGKVCVITGGTSGIGLETVRLFVQEGARVVFCGRGDAVGKEIAASVGANAEFVRADVTQEAEVKKVIEHAVAKWGRLDCLFNNAGGGVGLPSVTKVTQKAIAASQALNFDSVAWGIKYAVPHLAKQQRSSIISNSSIAAKRAGYGDALYCAAKAGIEAYSRAASMELAPKGIRVNTVSPGATATPIFWGGSPGSVRGKTLSQADNDVRQKKVEANILKNVSPLRVGRSGTGYDIAAAALYLASDDSMWFTGQDMVIDGGITTFDAPNKGWMADKPAVDPVPLRHGGGSKGGSLGRHGGGPGGGAAKL